MSEGGGWVPPARYLAPVAPGQRVRFRRLEGQFGYDDPELEGEGTFVRYRRDREECWDVELDDGEVIHVVPAYGDTMEAI